MIHTFKDKNRWLSNIATVPIYFNNQLYKSIEHAYQSAKSDSLEWKGFCVNEDNPYKIKIKSKTINIVEDWDNIKLNVMEECLIQKYNQEPFKSQLLSTENQNIQEGNEWGDTFFGIDLSKTPNYGENHLGRLIMKIRDNIKNI